MGSDWDEIDVTEDEFDRMLVEAEPVELINPVDAFMRNLPRQPTGNFYDLTIAQVEVAAAATPQPPRMSPRFAEPQNAGVPSTRE